MEHVQERVTTLHDFGDARPSVPTERVTVVLPMTAGDHASLAAEHTLSTLETVDPGRVVVALRAPPEEVGAVVSWVEDFDLTAEVLWCTAPPLESALAETGLDGDAGKGRDVWLGLGQARSAEYVVVHDADATSYGPGVVPRLCFPLTRGHQFAKGYYARVEADRLYGRLCRLFYDPVVRALAETETHPLVDFFGAFRYGLAGEFALTGDLAARLRVQRGWGLEVGTLGEIHRLIGAGGAAQVDLGVHQHDHRPVGGPAGLGDMCTEVGRALFRSVVDAGIDPDYPALRDRYRSVAGDMIGQYAADAAFNDLDYDAAAEREQVETYAGAIGPPGPDRRLPAWADVSLDPDRLRELSRSGIAEATER